METFLLLSLLLPFLSPGQNAGSEGHGHAMGDGDVPEPVKDSLATPSLKARGDSSRLLALLFTPLLHCRA